MSSQRYFIKLAYKGTHFFGWQIQPNAITVQETIAQCLAKLNHNNPIKIMGCGRTDTGVHASQFFAHFDIDRTIDTTKWQFKLNCMLPETIAIQGIFEVPKDLHTRFSAVSRTYQYFIHDTENPFKAETSWLMRQSLNLEKMNGACQLLLGTKNFKCFSKTTTGQSTYICDVTQAKWEKSDDGYVFTISANRFLRNMVRAIVGTLVDVGLGKKEVEDLKKILAGENRSSAGKSAPAEGLFLVKVDYDTDIDFGD